MKTVKTRICLGILCTFFLMLAYAALAKVMAARELKAQQPVCDLSNAASLGGCDNVYYGWFTRRTDVSEQTLRYSDGFSPAISPTVRNYSRLGVGCDYHVSVTITQKYTNGQICTATEHDNHNRRCDQCGAVGGRVSTVNSASFQAFVAADTITSAYSDQDFTTQTLTSPDADSAPGFQLVTELGGVRGFIDGQPMGLFFVSPRQVNFYVPAGVAAGQHFISFSTASGLTLTGDVVVNVNSPGIFTEDQNGSGQASAQWWVYRPGQPVRVYSWTSLQAAPGDRVFLILFGTGIISARATLRVNNKVYDSAYAGNAPTFVGLDQVNIEIPYADLWRGSLGAQLTSWEGQSSWQSNGFILKALPAQ